MAPFFFLPAHCFRVSKDALPMQKEKAPQRLCAHGAYAFLEIIAQLNDADRIQGCVNVQISASGTIPVESHNFGMRDVSKDIERLIVSRS